MTSVEDELDCLADGLVVELAQDPIERVGQQLVGQEQSD